MPQRLQGGNGEVLIMEKHGMEKTGAKKALRMLSAVSLATIAGMAFCTAPASALAWLGEAGPAIPGAEALALSLIGLGCLALARQRAGG
jgi:hypothetical protein